MEAPQQLAKKEGQRPLQGAGEGAGFRAPSQDFSKFRMEGEGGACAGCSGGSCSSCRGGSNNDSRVIDLSSIDLSLLGIASPSSGSAPGKGGMEAKKSGESGGGGGANLYFGEGFAPPRAAGEGGRRIEAAASWGGVGAAQARIAGEGFQPAAFAVHAGILQEEKRLSLIAQQGFSGAHSHHGTEGGAWGRQSGSYSAMGQRKRERAKLRELGNRAGAEERKRLAALEEEILKRQTQLEALRIKNLENALSSLDCPAADGTGGMSALRQAALPSSTAIHF